MSGAQRFPSLHRPLVVCLDPQPGHRGPCSLLTAAFTPGVFAGGRAAQGSPDGSRGHCLRPQPHGPAPLEWLGVQVVAFLHLGLQGPHCEPAKAARPVWSLRVRNQCRAGATSATESTFPGNTGSAWPALRTIHTAASYTWTPTPSEDPLREGELREGGWGGQRGRGEAQHLPPQGLSSCWRMKGSYSQGPEKEGT